MSNTYIQGINSSAAGTTAPIQTVCVDGSGKLWGTAGTCNASSRRFKDQIADMGDSSSKLFQLHPVSFFYKPRYDDGTHAVQYGLIAEEVAKVYPEMAVYDKDGQPSGVKYQLLAPMLLNELQKEHAVVMSQQDELQTQLQQINSQRQEIDSLKHEWCCRTRPCRSVCRSWNPMSPLRSRLHRKYKRQQPLPPPEDCGKVLG